MPGSSATPPISSPASGSAMRQLADQAPTGGGLPVEVWTRFMRSAHQGVPVADLPNAPRAGGLTTLTQIASQITGPTPPAPVQAGPGRPGRHALRCGRPAAGSMAG